MVGTKIRTQMEMFNSRDWDSVIHLQNNFVFDLDIDIKSENRAQTICCGNCVLSQYRKPHSILSKMMEEIGIKKFTFMIT